jgi:hypothetical protein
MDGLWNPLRPRQNCLLKRTVLVIDDTAIPKKVHSVGVAPQYASALGKTANCQTLASLTLARGEVSVMLALRLFYHGDNPAVGSASIGRRLLDALIPVDDVAGCPRTR